MASRVALAVMMTRGREFCRIQAISVLVRAGDTSVAVSPAAKTPSMIGAYGKQLGSWINTMGAISGRGQVGVGGRTLVSLGSRPCALMPAAMARASFLI